MTLNAPKTYLAALLAGALILTGCSTTGAATADASSAAAGHAVTEAAARTDTAADSDASGTIFDATKVHTVSLTVDAGALSDVLKTYADSGDKKWAKATVTIDGVTYKDVGIKLKGNSSLKNVTTSSKPGTLPWRIRLDKYVDGQNAGGYTDFTIRGNNSATSMNEAVALDLLGDAGLATEHSAQTAFSVNGSDATLRLAVQNLDDTWVKQNFSNAGAESVLYKSDADGDWSWRGTDGDYTSSFDIEAGPDNYTPLIELLDLLNNGTSAEITEKLPSLVDLDSFATYLAFEDLIGNFDDIDGPGNNSYLFWDSATKRFTIVAWDHNLAFGSSPGAGGQGGPGMGGGQRPGAAAGGANTGDTANDDTAAAPPDGSAANGTPPTDLPDGFTPPTGGAFPQGGPGGPAGRGGRGAAPGGTSNPLVKAFDANSDWTAWETAAKKKLQASLFDSGLRDTTVTTWANLLKSSASDLVDTATITKEADAIRTFSASTTGTSGGMMPGNRAGNGGATISTAPTSSAPATTAPKSTTATGN